MDENRNAGQGLFFLFSGELISLIGAVTLLLPVAVVGGIWQFGAGIAGSLLVLYGLFVISKIQSGYRKAFRLTLAGIFLQFLTIGLQMESAAYLLISFAVIVLNTMCIYHICLTTSGLLAPYDSVLAQRGDLIRKLAVGCTAATLASTCLAMVPIISILVTVALPVIGIAQIVQSVLYLMFLWKSQKVLQSV